MPKDQFNMQELDAQEAAAYEAATPTQEQVAEQMVIGVEKDVEQAGAEVYADGIANSNPGSFKRKQVESLKSFFDSPVSYGAVVGQALAGIIGGSQAGAAATPIAMGFHQMANQRYTQNQSLGAVANKEQNQFESPTGFVLKGTTTPVNKRKDGTFMFEGKVVSASQVENVSARESINRNNRFEESIERRDRGLDFRERSVLLREEEARDLSPKQYDSVNGARQALESIDRIDDLFNKTDVGQVVGRLKNVGELAGVNEEAFTLLKQELAFTVQSYQKAISGLTVTETERKFLEENLPKITDNPRVFQRKSAGFRNLISKLERRTLIDAKELQGRGPGTAAVTGNPTTKVKPNNPPGTTQTKVLGGKTYIKVNGGWRAQ